MNRNLFLVIMIILIFSCEKEDISSDRKESFTINSSSTYIDYIITVVLPEGYSNQTDTFSTLYLLDSDFFLNHVCHDCEKYSSKNNKKNVIVVGISGGNDREDDYTPTKTRDGGGKASEFLIFIKNDLILYIENHYKVSTNRENRVIIGYSYGGLCGAYAFSSFSDIFGNYLLLSPSLYYDNQIVLKNEQQNRHQLTNKQQLVYFSYGEIEPLMGPLIEIFKNRLDKYYPNSHSAFYIVPGKHHAGSAYSSIDHAINYYFESCKN